MAATRKQRQFLDEMIERAEIDKDAADKLRRAAAGDNPTSSRGHGAATPPTPTFPEV